MHLQEFLEKHGVSFATEGQNKHVRHNWLGVDCPWCMSTGKYHLGINLKSYACTCWKCGKRSLVSILVELCRCTPSTAYATATQLRKDQLPDDEEQNVEGRLELPKGREPLANAHKRYLARRGFDWERIVRLWQVEGFTVNSHEFRWRIFIPVYYRGKVVTWTTRAIADNAQLRYVTAKPTQESRPIKQCLYGSDYAIQSVIAVEGPTDVWNVGPGGVGTFGLNVSATQVKLLARYPVRYICFDNSETAQATAKKLADVLSILRGETYNVVLDADDPGSASKKEIKKIRRIVFGE